METDELLADLDRLVQTWRHYIQANPPKHGPLDPHARYLAGLDCCAGQVAEILARAKRETD